MYTQCSNCDTVFKLSADVLRAAGGQVRCGRCGEVFSALARLAENPSAFTAQETQQDLEERADNILESIPDAASTQHAPDIDETGAGDEHEIAHLQILDFSPGSSASHADPPAAPPNAAADDSAGEALDENSMEFTLPPGELDRIFVESKAGVPPPFPLTPPAQLATSAKNAVPPTSLPLTSAPPTPPPPPSLPTVEDDEGPLPDIEVVRDNRIGASAPGALLLSESARRQLQADVDPAEFDLGKRPSPLGRSNAVWLTAAICFALLLALQMVHHNREWLAAHAPFGSVLRSLYTSIGAPVSTPGNLAAYQLRQWGVTGDPGADGTLKVRASILNTTAQLVPYPLLRVTLANRYGTRMGARDFEPSEYLGKPTARLLAPGERVDATLQIRDPGKDAEGFEIDVCLRTTDRRIICANDAAAPQAKP